MKCNWIFCSVQMNHAELSPNYSGILFGITNTVASFSGFLAPIVFGVITTDNVSQYLRIVCDYLKYPRIIPSIP